jgi:hypothetical protein
MTQKQRNKRNETQYTEQINNNKDISITKREQDNTTEKEQGKKQRKRDKNQKKGTDNSSETNITVTTTGTEDTKSTLAHRQKDNSDKNKQYVEPSY